MMFLIDAAAVCLGAGFLAWLADRDVVVKMLETADDDGEQLP
jgi:hypothetical protein